MPRQSRIDAPGALHHVICRGLEIKLIFQDDVDRDAFLARLGDVLQKTSTRCFAWALIPNHFHLLLQTGSVPISTVMARVLTGYAGDFNRRHNRQGHLFQNRYKSILCQEDPYFLELVRYIHLNPLRARIVKSFADLHLYQYCGHAGLIGTAKYSWHTTEEVLIRFDANLSTATQKYETFIFEGIAAGKRPDLTGGGLVRSAGGWQSLVSTRRIDDYRKGDERILGDSDFVDEALNAASDGFEKKSYYQQKGLGLDWLVRVVADLLDVEVSELLRGGRKTTIVQARSLVCYWATQELGMTATSVGLRLKISQPTASRAVQRGEKLASGRKWNLQDKI
jgi:putative transposase